MKNWEWQNDDFKFGQILGSGQFANVFFATNVLYEHPVAIKVISKDKICSDSLYRRLEREIVLHSQLKHPNICEMFGYFTD